MPDRIKRPLIACGVATVGAGLIIAGVARIYTPAGVILAGLFLLLIGALLVDVTG